MVDLANPLTEQNLVEIKEALNNITQAENVAKLAERSGVDIGDRLETLAEQRKFLLAIKGNFFPNQ